MVFHNYCIKRFIFGDNWETTVASFYTVHIMLPGMSLFFMLPTHIFVRFLFVQHCYIPVIIYVRIYHSEINSKHVGFAHIRSRKRSRNRTNRNWTNKFQKRFCFVRLKISQCFFNILQLFMFKTYVSTVLRVYISNYRFVEVPKQHLIISKSESQISSRIRWKA